MNCWNGKMKRSSITLTYSSWRFKTVTSAPKALKSAIIASRARLSGLGGVLLAPCSSVGGRRGHGSRSRPQVGAAGHGCRFPPSIDARLSRRRAQHGLLSAYRRGGFAPAPGPHSGRSPGRGWRPRVEPARRGLHGAAVGSAARVSRRSGGRDQGGWSPIRVTHPRAPASRPASGWRGRAGRLGASGPFGIDECSGARPCGLRQVRWRALAVPPLGMGRRGRD